jgi:hypothetical protein
MNNPLDQTALVDCKLSMRLMTVGANPFALQIVGAYQ